VVLLLAGALLCWFLLDASTPPWTKAHTLEWGKGHWPNAVEKLGKFWPPLWLFMVWALAAGRKRIALAGLLALLLVALPVGALKYSVCRLRPYASPPAHWTKTSYSFPSGDAAQAFATAVAAAALMRGRWRWLPFAVAAAVAVLRVLNCRHYPSDVLTGAAVGLAMGAVALAAWRAILRRPPSTAPPGRWTRLVAWFWGQPRRPAWLGWIVLGLPFAEAFANAEIAVCLRGFGPFLAAALLLAKGEAWLRWLRTSRPPSSAAPALVLVAMTLLAILPSLGWVSLYDRDEGYYAECAREMVQRRDPLVPHFGGKPWMEKRLFSTGSWPCRCRSLGGMPSAPMSSLCACRPRSSARYACGSSTGWGAICSTAAPELWRRARWPCVRSSPRSRAWPCSTPASPPRC